MNVAWEMSAVYGVLVVTIAGLGTGTCLWPMKLIHKFKFEHYWFVGMLPLLIVPWLIVLGGVPDPLGACGDLVANHGWRPLIVSNLFAVGWGLANVLGGICVARIGYVLTGAILTGLGVTVVVILPMVVKGSGQFSQAPSLTSAAGLTAMTAVGVILVGVVITALAGFGRQEAIREPVVVDSACIASKTRNQPDRKASGGFLGGLIMTILAGALSAGMPMAFVYGQGPIREAMEAHGAGEISSNMAVWAVGLFAGTLVNILYPAFLMTKNKSWGVIATCSPEPLLSALIGTQLILSVALAGYGSLLLGTLGASVGFGLQQATQIMGTQGVGFASGEWRGVHGRPRRQMYGAIAILTIGVAIMVCARMLG